MAILAAAFGSGAHAAKINYRFELEALHSDNINLSENNQASETVFIPRLKFDVLEEGAAIELQARGELERRHYMQDEFEDETRGQFAGQLNWALLPQRLNFVLEDYLSEQPINIRDGRYPGNLQQVNVFLGGPSFFARMGDATRFQLDLRGADTHAEESPGFDSTRYSAAGALYRDLTSASTGSLHLISTKVEFDDPIESVDYTRNDGFARYDGTFRNVQYQLDLGYARLNRDSGGDETISIERATIDWQISPRSRLRFRGRHQFADEVQDIVVRLREPDEDLVPDLVDASSSLVSGSVYRQRDVELDYRFTGGRYSFRMRPRDRRFVYIDNGDQDRKERGVYYQVGYRLRPTMNLTFSGSWRERDFLNRDEKDIDHIYSLAFDHQWTRHWGWSAEIIMNNRDSNLADPVYNENAALLNIWWQR
ncbi:hypothetical protein ACFPOA_08475 [Lysobacter niabensis]|uniref:hypothetical protein n=1 Tax=Agrilutibacter niabensis TaxID=380628 RepID=UPI00360E69CC